MAVAEVPRVPSVVPRCAECRKLARVPLLRAVVINRETLKDGIPISVVRSVWDSSQGAFLLQLHHAFSLAPRDTNAAGIYIQVISWRIEKLGYHDLIVRVHQPLLSDDLDVTVIGAPSRIQEVYSDLLSAIYRPLTREELSTALTRWNQEGQSVPGDPGKWVVSQSLLQQGFVDGVISQSSTPMSQNDVLSWYQEVFSTSCPSITLGGHLGIQFGTSVAQKLTVGPQCPRSEPRRDVPQSQDSPKHLVTDTGLERIAVSSSSVQTASTRQRAAIELLNQYIGGDPSGLIQRSLRTQQGVSYDAHSSLVMTHGRALILLYASCTVSARSALPGLLSGVLEAVTRHNMNADDLSRIKTVLSSTHAQRSSNPSLVMDDLEHDTLWTTQDQHSLDTTSADDIRVLAASIFARANIRIASAGDLIFITAARAISAY